MRPKGCARTRLQIADVPGRNSRLPPRGRRRRPFVFPAAPGRGSRGGVRSGPPFECGRAPAAVKSRGSSSCLRCAAVTRWSDCRRRVVAGAGAGVGVRECSATCPPRRARIRPARMTRERRSPPPAYCPPPERSADGIASSLSPTPASKTERRFVIERREVRIVRVTRVERLDDRTVLWQNAGSVGWKLQPRVSSRMRLAERGESVRSVKGPFC